MKQFFTLLLCSILSLGYVQSNAQAGCVTPVYPLNGETDVPLSITLEWNAPVSGETPISYHVFWGTNPASLFEISNTTGLTASVDQFNLNFTYYWRVDVESASGITPGCETFSYVTIGIPQAPGVSCGSNAPVDYTFNLETNPGWWTGDIGTGTQSAKWNFRTGQTPSPNTGPLGAYEGSQYLYYESSFASAGASVVSPEIDLSTVTGDIDMTFYFFAFGAEIQDFEVGVSTSATGPFDNIWSWSGGLQSANSDAWQLVGFNLSAYAGQKVYIEFKTVIINNPTSGAADVAIDLLEVHGCQITIPAHSDCINALTLATGGEPGSLIDENTMNATSSNIGASACNAIESNDLFYSVETDADGGGLFIDVTSGVNSKYTIILYDGSCGGLSEIACASASANGDNVQLDYFVSGVTGSQNTSRLAPQTFIVRVYDENNAGENFNIDAFGSALATLPITLLDWKATLERESVLLQWSTAQEVNSDRFVMEKSRDGHVWSTLTEINANGYSNELSKYSYSDYELFALQYYRLKSIDFDGSFEYSSIINIKRDDIKVETFPNPAMHVIHIDGTKLLNDQVFIRVFGSNGAEVMSKNVLTNNTIELDITSLLQGLYNVRIEDGNMLYSTSFIKQ